MPPRRSRHKIAATTGTYEFLKSPGRLPAGANLLTSGRDASDMMKQRIALAAALLLFLPWAARAEDGPQHFSIGILRQAKEPPSWASPLELPPEDEGFAGARLAVRDNETTGRFLNQTFSLGEASVAPDADPLPAFETLINEGRSYIVLDLPADQLLRIADAARGRNLVLFNAGAADDRLRNADCRDTILHIAPSRAMLTDALAQYLMAKRWRKWLLITGRREEDKLYAEAVRRSAKKFGARIVAEKVWEFGPDARRTAQAEVAPFTQGVDYDIAVIADEIGEFGDLILFHTWDPRPTGGTQGLVPTSWHRTHEAWGAAQLQSRFYRLAKRPMRALDYQMWIAVRAVGEAAMRAKSADVTAVRDYLRSPDFEVAAFKGVPLNFRSWDWQLRQPIMLVQPAALVSVSPQAGYLHQRTPLDTLGFDQPESACRLGGPGR